MGATSSSMVGAKGYSLRAQANKKFADSILTMMFKNTDFQDLLTLTNLSACPKYVFTTAKALSAMFTKMQVVPIKGKSQEILFAPLSSLSPTDASIKGSSVNKGRILAARLAEQNELCMEIAYFYIRIFQIYAALALTVMDADPVRARRIAAAAVPVARGAVATPSAAPFAQRGGAFLISSTEFKSIPLFQVFNNSLFANFAGYLEIEPRAVSEYRISGQLQVLIKASTTSKDALLLIFDEKSLQENDVSAYYLTQKDATSQFKVSINISEDNKYAILTSDRYNDILQVEIPSKKIQPFTDELKILGEPPSQYFARRFQKVFKSTDESGILPSSYSGLGPSIQAAPARYVAPQIQVSSGQSVFEGFEQLKKLYASKTTTPTFVFPKAYCIARAMTLMNPIFKEELAKPTDMTVVQICSPKYDFEVGGQEYMPRARNVASANLYFKSFIALFYDSFTIGGGTIQFTQTEDGKSKLAEASKLLARLYNIRPDDQIKFLAGSIQFPSISLCLTDATKGTPTVMYIKDPAFRNQIFTENILPMLQHQEQHTAKVNNLLKKMFTMKGEQLFFNPKLLAGGRVELNEIGYEAHQLLLDYYLKSEAYYIKGCIAFNNNKGKLQV